MLRYSPAKVGSNICMQYIIHMYMVLVIGKKVVARVLPEQAPLLRNHVMYSTDNHPALLSDGFTQDQQCPLPHGAV